MKIRLQIGGEIWRKREGREQKARLKMASCLSIGTIVHCRVPNFNSPSASLSLLTGSRTTNAASLQMKPKNQISSGTLLHSSFTPSTLSFASASSFSGNSLVLGLDLKSSSCRVANRRRRLVVRAVKYVLCQTKRNRSRKSLARTHGFRKRMSTTKGRATIKRRREKGRWNLCTKTNPNSGKRA